MVSSSAAPSATPPPPPALPTPDKSDPIYPLWLRVQEALQALPLYFDSKTTIEGIEAGDLFSLNSVLGSTIEVQVVAALNRIRDTWDPPNPGSTSGAYAQYGFVRMPQSYPDVRLQKTGAPADVLLGLELKGWYLLSKEREPSYRFTATPVAASEWDLLVVVPWYLTNVLSGRPTVLEPFVRPARWAADYRNWYWEWRRRNPQKRPQVRRGVRHPVGVTPPPPYPSGKTEMADVPIEDTGKNFGRFSRAGVMDDYIARLLEVTVSGIAAGDWIEFFKLFTESSTRKNITDELRARALLLAASERPDEAAAGAIQLVRDLLAAVDVADSDDEDDDLSRVDATRLAIRTLRREFEQIVRAGADVGLEDKELRKLSGLAPAALRNIRDSAERAPATPPGLEPGGVPDAAAGDLAG